VNPTKWNPYRTPCAAWPHVGDLFAILAADLIILARVNYEVATDFMVNELVRGAKVYRSRSHGGVSW
jgi:hypothetical protein